MSVSSIEERVNSVVNEVLRVNLAKIMPTSRIREDLGADSLDQVSLILALEDEFAGSISEQEAKAMVTVGDIVSYIEAQELQTQDLSPALHA